MIKVWWADGRITVQTFDSRSQAHDVISGECKPFDRYELVGGPVTVELQAKILCAALNARAEVFEARNGKAPLYRDFGFEIGRKYADELEKGVTGAVTAWANGYVESFTSWSYAKDAFDKWAAIFARRFDEVRGISPNS